MKPRPIDAVSSILDAVSAKSLKVDFGLAVSTALQKFQQDLATKEIEQWMRSELEKTEQREKLGTIEKTPKLEKKEIPISRGLKKILTPGRHWE